MPRNDNKPDLKWTNTRILRKTVEESHKNNPHVSLESAFSYVMANSATFRALPTACIEKARRYLALPETDPDKTFQNLSDAGVFPIFIIPVGPTDSKGMTPIRWECNGLPPTALKDILESMGIQSSDEKGDPDIPGISIPRLNKDRLAEFINRVTRNASTHESIGHTFGRIRRESAEFTQMHPIDIHNAWTQLTEIQANESTKEPDGHIPLNGQQTVDYLVGLTNDLALISGTSVHGTTSHTISFDSACDRLGRLKNLRIEDIIKARKELGLSTQLIESVAQCKNTAQPKKPIKPSTTVVHAERVVVDNKKMIKILKFENVAHAADLPDTYHMGVPKFYRNSTGIVLYQLANDLTTVVVDMLPSNVFILEGFDQMIIAMKEAAARLSKINKTVKLEKEHSGKFTVSI